jgi:hypothetical protein
MKKIQGSNYFTFLCVACLCAAPSFAQDAATPKKDEKAAGKPDEAAMMATMMELAKPGENHKILQGMVGTWTYKVKFWVTPDTTPMESSGTTMTRPAMGGRYFISDHKGMMQMPGPDGAMQNMEFNGMAIEGYDNVKKKFVSSWIDNMGTGIMNSEGTFDSAAHALTYASEYEPMPGMKTKVRQLITINDQNHHKMEFFEMRGDKEVKTMEIDYARSGAAPGPGVLRVPTQNKIKSTTSE